MHVFRTLDGLDSLLRPPKDSRCDEKTCCQVGAARMAGSHSTARLPLPVAGPRYPSPIVLPLSCRRISQSIHSQSATSDEIEQGLEQTRLTEDSSLGVHGRVGRLLDERATSVRVSLSGRTTSGGWDQRSIAEMARRTKIRDGILTTGLSQNR